MTPTQKRLRDLRDRQSRERGRMAELSLVDELTDEQRAELDTIERGTPDLERQTRAATVALETEEREAETRAATAPDAEQRERIELRSKAMLTNYLMNAARGRMADGAEAELQSAAGINGHGIPVELWDVARPERRSAEDGRETRAITPAPGTDRRKSRSDPAGRVRQFNRASPWRRNAARHVRHLRERHDHDFPVRRRARQVRRGRRHRRCLDRDHGDSEARERTA